MFSEDMKDSRALFISLTAGFSQSLKLEYLLSSPGSSLQAISITPDNSVPHRGLTARTLSSLPRSPVWAAPYLYDGWFDTCLAIHK